MFNIENGVLKSYSGDSADVQIPYGVTTIDDYAFQSCNLTTVIINNSTPPSFGTYNPFMYCAALESIYVPDDKVDDYKAIGALSDVNAKIKGISQKP